MKVESLLPTLQEFKKRTIKEYYEQIYVKILDEMDKFLKIYKLN